MIKRNPILFLSFITLASTSIGFAQPGGGPSPPDNPGPVDDIPVPIDQHLWILIFLAIAVGLYVIWLKKSRLSN